MPSRLEINKQIQAFKKMSREGHDSEASEAMGNYRSRLDPSDQGILDELCKLEYTSHTWRLEREFENHSGQKLPRRKKGFDKG